MSNLLTNPSCVHCGFCLPDCPTYDVLGTEMDNPRGRLYLMDLLEAGQIEPTAAVRRHLDLCLGCRACETACPSGVKYGERLEATRARLSRQRKTRPGTSTGRWVRRLLALPPWIQRFGLVLLRRLQSLGLTAHPDRWPGSMAPMLRLLAAAPDARPRDPLAWTRPRPKGLATKRVGLLTGCVNQLLFSHVNDAATLLLERAGCEVIIPSGQRCCGALHSHAGDVKGARRLARANIIAFERAGDLDAIVVTAAGCGSAMADYGRLFGEDDALRGRAGRFASRVADALVVLDEVGLPPPTHSVPARVAYHDACHLAHGQGVVDGPRRLLGQIPDLELIPLEDSDRCCGSAGVYNLEHPEVASELLKAKLSRLADTRADVVAAANPGCLLQLASAGGTLAVVHPLELLAQAHR